MLLRWQPIHKHHLGGHCITPLDMADVIPLDAPGGCRKLQELSQVFSRQRLLFLPLLGTQQFKFSIPLHQVDQIRLLATLRTLNLYPSFALFPKPFLHQPLLRQRMLHKHLRRHLNGINLAVVLLDHALKNLTWLKSLGVGRVTEAAHQLACAHLEQLHSCNALVTGQSQDISAH